MFTVFSCFCFSDGEIISQIKMTNIALAEIKELLKQQVRTQARSSRSNLKGGNLKKTQHD